LDRAKCAPQMHRQKEGQKISYYITHG